MYNGKTFRRSMAAEFYSFARTGLVGLGYSSVAGDVSPPHVPTAHKCLSCSNILLSVSFFSSCSIIVMILPKRPVSTS
jgi:hypothetical protein